MSDSYERAVRDEARRNGPPPSRQYYHSHEYGNETNGQEKTIVCYDAADLTRNGKTVTGTILEKNLVRGHVSALVSQRARDIETEDLIWVWQRGDDFEVICATLRVERQQPKQVDLIEVAELNQDSDSVSQVVMDEIDSMSFTVADGTRMTFHGVKRLVSNTRKYRTNLALFDEVQLTFHSKSVVGLYAEHQPDCRLENVNIYPVTGYARAVRIPSNDVTRFIFAIQRCMPRTSTKKGSAILMKELEEDGSFIFVQDKENIRVPKEDITALRDVFTQLLVSSKNE